MPNRFELTLRLEDRLVQSEDLYARLELLNPELPSARRTEQSLTVGAVTPLWQRWSGALFRYFVGSQEPRITTKHRHNQTVYEVYDPVDRRRHTFSSEQEVRVWLEERYYQ